MSRTKNTIRQHDATSDPQNNDDSTENNENEANNNNDMQQEHFNLIRTKGHY